MSDQYAKDEVWAAAKFIWENTPEITDRELIEQLQIEYGNTAPKSTGTISKRRKKEEWRKQDLTNSLKIGAYTEAGGQGSKRNRKQKTHNSKIIPSKTNKAQNTEADRKLEAAGSKIGEITESVVIDAQGRAAIINKTRRRYANLGKLFDQAIGITLSIVDLADEADKAEQKALAGNYGAGFEIGENDKKSQEPENEVEAAAQKVQKAMVLSKALTDTTTSLAIALKTISEVEMPLCGITADDFKQSDQDRRLGALAALGDIDAKEREARERLAPELHERLKRIMATEASDDFGREDRVDDIDDIDYTSVD